MTDFSALSPDELQIIAFDAERLRTDPAFQRGVKFLDARLTEQMIQLDPLNQQDEMIQTQALIRALRGLAMEIAVAARMANNGFAANDADNRHGTAVQ